MKISKLNNIMVGAGRVLDISQSYNAELQKKYLDTSFSNLDRDALKSDWISVGNSLKNALREFREGEGQNTEHNHAQG